MPSKTEDGAGAAAGSYEARVEHHKCREHDQHGKAEKPSKCLPQSGQLRGEFQAFARNREVVVLQIQTRPCAAPKRGYHAHTPIDQLRDAARQPDV